MKGVSLLLDDGGILSAEFPYLGDLNQNVEYDTIYHEHLSYFSLNPINHLLNEFGLKLTGVARLEVHGGSIRITAEKSKRTRPRIQFLDFEKKSGLQLLKSYETLSYRVEYQKQYLRHLLTEIKSKGHKVIGYGAPAKGNTLLNVCKIGPETVSYLIDTTPEKQGKFAPGSHIPVYDTSRFRNDEPEFALMLAWNYEKEIIIKEKDYLGQFIIPIPYPRVLSRNSVTRIPERQTEGA
jgi:hypothetical protein